MTYKGTMDGRLFITFLERLLRGATRKVFLIVDRLRAHDGGGGGLGRGASGPDRVVLPADATPPS